MSDSSVQSEDSLLRFESVLAVVNQDALIDLAKRLRAEKEASLDVRATLESVSISNERFECKIKSPPICGSYNVVQVIEFSDGVHWILRIPGTGTTDKWTPDSSRALKSSARTMQFLKANTTIPLPEVYHYSSSVDNEIGVPYILMSFLEGKPVYEAWWDESESQTREERRLRILNSTAEAMSQLAKFQFSQTGSVLFDDTLTITGIGDCTIPDEWANLRNFSLDVDAGPQSRTIGPFQNSQDYFLSLLPTESTSNDPFSVGIHKLLQMMIRCLPPSIQSLEISTNPIKLEETFVLHHPDTDSQNFLVDRDGTLTGILDWDGVHVGPKHISYQRYPNWVTRDWDPAMYGYDMEDCRPEDSPADLEAYRLQYSKAIASLLPHSIDYTSKSHLYEALQIAASNPICTDSIVEKIFLHLFPSKDDSGEERRWRRDGPTCKDTRGELGWD